MAAVGLAAGIPLLAPLGDLTGGGLGLGALFTTIFLYNIMLAVFNLLPAFPLDGGRIFRALLAMRLDYVRATNIAATIGRILAVGLGLYGLFAGGLFTILVALFIYTAAGAEAREAAVRGALRGHTVQNAYSPSVYRLAPTTTIQQAANLMLYGGQRNFPVVDGERLVGFLAYQDLVAAVRTSPAYTPVDQIMRTDVAPLEPSLDLYEAQHRLREQEVEALPVAGRGRFLGLIGLGQIEQYLRLLKVAPNVITQGQSA
jgi:CBS domain-containing protein